MQNVNATEDSIHVRCSLFIPYYKIYTTKDSILVCCLCNTVKFTLQKTVFLCAVYPML